MGASPLRVLFDVMLLESLPQTFVGLRNGVSLALVIIVVAEMFIGSVDGLGQRVFEAQQLFDMPGMYAAIFAAGALGYTLNLLFLADRAPLRALGRALKRDEIWPNHHRALASCLSMTGKPLHTFPDHALERVATYTAPTIPRLRAGPSRHPDGRGRGFRSRARAGSPWPAVRKRFADATPR